MRREIRSEFEWESYTCALLELRTPCLDSSHYAVLEDHL